MNLPYEKTVKKDRCRKSAASSLALQDTDIIGPFKGGRVGDMLLAEDSFEVRNGTETHPLHPGFQVGGHGPEISDAVLVERGGCHGNIGACQQVFDDFSSALYAGGAGE